MTLDPRHVLPVSAVLLFAACGPAPTQEPKPAAAPAAAPLVTRERVQLNLAGAELILAAAKQRRAPAGGKRTRGAAAAAGPPPASAGMVAARPASGYTGWTKGGPAATFRQETGPLPPKGEPDLLLTLSLQS